MKSNKPERAQASRALMEARGRVVASQVEADECRQAQIALNTDQRVAAQAFEEVNVIHCHADRWAAYARVYSEQCARLRGWISSVELSGQRFEGPELFDMRSPGKCEMARHAVHETYRALARCLNGDSRRASNALNEHRARYWQEVAAHLVETAPPELYAFVQKWSIAKRRSGGREYFDPTDLPGLQGVEAALDSEYGFEQEVTV